MPKSRRLEKKRPATIPAYDQFASFYDSYWCRDVAADFAGAVERLLLPPLKRGSSILDVCCGSGRVTAQVAARGFKLTGVDNSEKMLEIAKRNAHGASFYKADVRTFSMSENFDAAYSVFDSLNHLMSLRDLESAFIHIFQALKPGGLFLFDMNLDRGFRLHWQEDFQVVEDDQVCVVQGFYDSDLSIGIYDFTLFSKHGRSWDRSDFTVSERCFRWRDIRASLLRSGFSNLLKFDAEKDLGMIDHAGRIFVLVEKPPTGEVISCQRLDVSKRKSTG